MAESEFAFLLPSWLSTGL